MSFTLNEASHWMVYNRVEGYILMAITVISWGFSTIFIERGLSYVTPIWFLAWRFTLATLLLSPWILATRRSQTMVLIRDKWVWLIAISETAGLLFQYFGQQLGASPGISALISLTFLVIVPFMSLYFLKEQIHAFHGVAIIIGMVGVLAIQTEFNLSDLDPFGESQIAITLLFLSAISYAFYIVFTSRLTTIENPQVDTTTLFYVVLGIISFLSIIAGVLAEPTTVLPSPEGWVWIGALTGISTIIAFFTYFKALTVISANEASVLLLLQVTVPFFYELVVEKIVYSIEKWTGIALIMIAMIVVVTGSNKYSTSGELNPVQEPH